MSEIDGTLEGALIRIKNLETFRVLTGRTLHGHTDRLVGGWQRLDELEERLASAAIAGVLVKECERRRVEGERRLQKLEEKLEATHQILIATSNRVDDLEADEDDPPVNPVLEVAGVDPIKKEVRVRVPLGWILTEVVGR
jgi:hypothetical protein